MFVFMSFSKVPSLMAAKDMDETLSILSKEAEVKQKYSNILKYSIQYPDKSFLYSAQLGPVLHQDPEL